MTHAGIDTSTAHPARRYNYWLGGKDNFAADRESGDEIERRFPGMRAGVRANRDVLGRMVTYLARDAGIRQFLDIGTGLPTADNTHEVAQRLAPDSRIIYVDNDPLVMTHARALLDGSPHGRTGYVEADLRSPETILDDPQVREVLDLAQPVALMLVAVLHFLPGQGEAKKAVDHLMQALPSGSYLALTHVTVDFMPPTDAQGYLAMVESGRLDIWPRPEAEVQDLFEGLDLVEPGVVLGTRWRPQPGQEEAEARLVSFYAAVGRKP
ncbi:SAM-dependent methyltransferase [Actinoplanes sp. TFC3]|uniref:SAM-dependent methyltransferase n=1 Tax=Actinoplanes sp. TFC3 TaxID=1710355 RepID=UPI000836AA81|nr:SAM-dependent methyltransferase [Actinoplanes sp. TFC3]